MVSRLGVFLRKSPKPAGHQRVTQSNFVSPQAGQ